MDSGRTSAQAGPLKIPCAASALQARKAAAMRCFARRSALEIGRWKAAAAAAPPEEPPAVLKCQSWRLIVPPAMPCGCRWSSEPSPAEPKPITSAVGTPAGSAKDRTAGRRKRSPSGSSFAPLMTVAASGESARSMSGVSAIVVSSDSAPAGIVSVRPPLPRVPPARPMVALTRRGASRIGVETPSKRTCRPIVPLWPPGLVALTVVRPGPASAGTRNVALLPVAETTSAVLSSTLILTFLAPKPWPVIVISAPRSAIAGVIESTVTFAAAASARNAEATSVSERRPASRRAMRPKLRPLPPALQSRKTTWN